MNRFLIPFSFLLAGCTFTNYLDEAVELSKALPACNKNFLKTFEKNSMSKSIEGITILENKDLRDLDYPPMRTTWPVSLTYKLNLKDQEKDETKEYFIVCKYNTNSLKDNLGVTSIKIYRDKSLPFSKINK